MRSGSTKRPTDGLVNVGNTCFLNAAFQALRFTRPLQEFLGVDTGLDAWRTSLHILEPRPPTALNSKDRALIAAHTGTELVVQTAALVKSLCSQSKSHIWIDPRPFVRAFFEFAGSTSDEFRFGHMGDASEALHAILDGLHTHVCRPVSMTIRGVARTPAERELVDSFHSWSAFFYKEYSPFINHYYGQTQMRTMCRCGESKTVYEPWSTLKISIPGGDTAGAPVPSFRACVNTAFMPEVVDDYRCDSCKQVGQTVKYYSISRFPDVLLLVFKRFTDRLAKIQARIEYDPDCVDLEEWGAWTPTTPTPTPTPTGIDAAGTQNGLRRPPSIEGAASVAAHVGAGMYTVVSTIEQSGNMRGGHYSIRTRAETGVWRVYDDETVFPDSTRGAPTSDTYVLVLERLSDE